MYVYTVYSYKNCRKTASQLGKRICPTGKIIFPNWEIIFSQLSAVCLCEYLCTAFFLRKTLAKSWLFHDFSVPLHAEE